MNFYKNRSTTRKPLALLLMTPLLLIVACTGKEQVEEPVNFDPTPAAAESQGSIIQEITTEHEELVGGYRAVRVFDIQVYEDQVVRCVETGASEYVKSGGGMGMGQGLSCDWGNPRPITQ